MNKETNSKIKEVKIKDGCDLQNIFQLLALQDFVATKFKKLMAGLEPAQYLD